MADEKIEKKIEETGAPKKDGELTEADFEKVAGGGHVGKQDSPNPASGSTTIKGCCV